MKHPVLVDLNLPQRGFHHFISSWVFQINGKMYVIDPGPTNSIPLLLKELRRLGIESIDYLLLTHIHLDHGGGAGTLIRQIPVSKVVCHPKAIPHLSNPAQLNQGSRETLGPIADLFGYAESVPSELCVSSEVLTSENPDVQVIPSPGHAVHHISFLIGGYLFVGEALGVTVPFPTTGERTSIGHKVCYLRPATPPRFIYEVYLQSIERLEAVTARTLCFGHYGATAAQSDIFRRARNQIDIWRTFVDVALQSGSFHSHAEISTILSRLMAIDPDFRTFQDLPDDIQEREALFIRNTLEGLRREATA